MIVNNLSESKKVYNLIKKSLDVSQTREKVISNNIANINTKGYKRQYVNFEDVLKMSKDKIQINTTDRKHITNFKADESATIKRDESNSMRKDGNNVDPDVEMIDLAANTLKYNALITQLNSRLSTRRYIITGGR